MKKKCDEAKMQTITLSRKISETESSKRVLDLPESSVPFTKFQHLYQYTTYIKTELDTHDKDTPRYSYIPLQFVREDNVTIAQSIGPEIYITCNALDDNRTVEFSKGYFMLLVKRNQVYTNMNVKRAEKVTW